MEEAGKKKRLEGASSDIENKAKALMKNCNQEDNHGRKKAFVNFEESSMASKCMEEMHMMEVRTPEEIENSEEERKNEEVSPDGHPTGKLLVCRAQKKSERQANSIMCTAQILDLHFAFKWSNTKLTPRHYCCLIFLRLPLASIA